MDNPDKNYILKVKGTQEEVVKALKVMIELLSDKPNSVNKTIQGEVWAWKDTPMETTAEFKIL
jgi:hypothetical protein